MLGVEIDNSRVVWIYNSERASANPVLLTTVAENQQKADINFYFKSKDKKYFICTETVSGLPAMHAGEPSIDIRPMISKKIFYYEIYINGKLIRRNSQTLSPYLRSKTPLIIAGGLLTAAAIVLLAVLLLQRDSDTLPAPSPSPSAEAPAVEVTAEPNEPAIPAETSTEMPEMPEQAVEEQTPEEPELPKPAEQVFIESEITDRYSVYFEPESDILTAEAVSGLKTFIDKLPKENDFEEALFKLEIRGHCARYGTEEGRAELSKERALRVYNYLKTGWGIEADSFVTGAGASEPVSLKRDEQHLNRRVDINIKGNLKTIEQTE